MTSLRALSDDLEQVVTRSLEAHLVPGAAVGILLGEQEHAAAFGVTSIDNPLPVTADTLFQIGSITKTVVATAVMRLVERGAIELDEPVRSYLPGLKLDDEDVAQRVTMRHLLTHTSGWTGDYFGDTGDGTDALERIVADMDNLEQLTPLGEVWSYNNSGFYIAGRILSVITGKEFEDAITDLVLEPLEMINSFFFANDIITRRFAVGHITIDGTPTIARPWFLPRGTHPAGGINSAVVDQLRYARFQLSDGKAPSGSQLLAPASIRAMRSPQCQAGGDIEWIGLSWQLRDVGGRRLVFHSGATNGQNALLLLAPERSFAFVMLTNSDSGHLATAETERWVLPRLLGVVEPELPHLDLAPAELEPYAGCYESPYGLLNLCVEDGDLVLHLTPKPFLEHMDPEPPTPPPTRLGFYAVDRAVALDGELQGSYGDFLRYEDGSLAWLRIFGRIARRVEPGS